MFLLENYVFKLSAVCFQPARVYLHSISISSTLMVADTESAPLADLGSRLLQTCGYGLSAALANASKIQLDSNKLDPVEFDLHLRKSEEIAAGFKSWGDSQKRLFGFKASVTVGWLHCVSNYLPVTGSAIGHLVRARAMVLCSTVQSDRKKWFQKINIQNTEVIQRIDWKSQTAIRKNLPQTSSARGFSQSQCHEK